MISPGTRAPPRLVSKTVAQHLAFTLQVLKAPTALCRSHQSVAGKPQAQSRVLPLPDCPPPRPADSRVLGYKWRERSVENVAMTPSPWPRTGLLKGWPTRSCPPGDTSKENPFLRTSWASLSAGHQALWPSKWEKSAYGFRNNLRYNKLEKYNREKISVESCWQDLFFFFFKRPGFKDLQVSVQTSIYWLGQNPNPHPSIPTSWEGLTWSCSLCGIGK